MEHLFTSTSVSRRVISAIAASSLLLAGGCDTSKNKNATEKPPRQIATCVGNTPIKIGRSEHPSLNSLIEQHTKLDDPLYEDFYRSIHTITISRGQAGKLGSKVSAFAVRDYSWFMSPPEPKAGTTVYVPSECYSKQNTPPKKK